jgi:hypothetical protein
MKVALLFIGVLAGILVTSAVGQRRDNSQPWLEPAHPTQLEWLALEKQATEGQNDFGDNGMTINFYVAPESNQTGVIFCDIAYTPQVTAAVLQLTEDSIRHRFDAERAQYPWAHVKIITKAAP